ncbi:MAG: S26 family signal peptidase, partial [Planctomycetota bacterium]
MADATKDKHKTSSASIKELLISLVISFTMAFIFRGFAIEGFEIPTGSMGPTLLGKHVLVINPETGYRWVVGPKPTQLGVPPAPVQENVSVAGPMSGERIDLARERLRGGDRLFVLKYLRGLYDPDRWDVVVFRAPHANSNYIKRLIGLPNEQLAIVDGDVFTHPLGEIPAGWDEPSWSIQRKPEIVQRAVWQPMFDSSFTPPNPARRFRAPWIGEGSGWEGIRDARVYRYTRSAATSLAWDHENRPITDRTYYNDSGPPGGDHFPVSDVATSLGIEPEDAGVSATVELEARGMTFRASIEDST